MGATGKESFDHLLGQGEEYELRPGTEPLYNVHDPKEAAIVGWRVDCFVRAGMELGAAAALAVRRDIDRARVESMLAAGASSAQVCEVLL